MSKTIADAIRSRVTFYITCGLPICNHSLQIDLEALGARLGLDHAPCMVFRCGQCKEVGRGPRPVFFTCIPGPASPPESGPTRNWQFRSARAARPSTAAHDYALSVVPTNPPQTLYRFAVFGDYGYTDVSGEKAISAMVHAGTSISFSRSATTCTRRSCWMLQSASDTRLHRQLAGRVRERQQHQAASFAPGVGETAAGLPGGALDIACGWFCTHQIAS